MTPKERALSIMLGLDHEDRAEFETLIEQAITAAIEEDRRSRPHEFIGRADRGCELCGEPDRDTIHCYSREHSKRFADRAVEQAKAEQVSVTAKAERDECLKILQKTYQEWVDGDYAPGEAFESAKDRIRARGD